MNDDLVAKAKQLAPLLKERAREGEINREVPRETIEEFVNSGILRAIQPRRFGGHHSPLTQSGGASTDISAT